VNLAVITPETPGGFVLARGYIGLVAWTIERLGDNLRIDLDRPHIDVGTLGEAEQLRTFAEALLRARTEIL